MLNTAVNLNEIQIKINKTIENIVKFLLLNTFK